MFKMLYQMVYMKNDERIIKFKSSNIDSVLGYLQWYIRKYKHGLLLEILKAKKVYDCKLKSVRYIYE